MAATTYIKKNQHQQEIVKHKFDGICAKISTIYFDLDNTLIPTRTGDSKAIRKLADWLESQYNFNKDDAILATQTFLKAFRRCPDNSQTSLDSWRTYLWREALPIRYKQYAEQIYIKWLQLRYRYLALTSDYIELLKNLRESGYALALITNGPSNAQWEKVHKLHVRQYFDLILVSSDLTWEKPHPNIFYEACNYLNVKPQECAMIGDKLETDIKGGYLANLGLTFWTPLNPNKIKDELHDAEYLPHITLNNLLELYKYLPKLNNYAAKAITTTAMTANASTSATTATTTSTTATTLTQNQRRYSQISCSTATGTCDTSDKYNMNMKQLHKQNIYRRGNSLKLTNMDCCNSETDNSCDSTFS